MSGKPDPLAFFGVGLAKRLPSREREDVCCVFLEHWCCWQAFREARERSDFAAMLTAELRAEACAAWLRDRLVEMHGLGWPALERHLEDQKRFVLHRAEQCERCSFRWEDFRQLRWVFANTSGSFIQRHCWIKRPRG